MDIRKLSLKQGYFSKHASSVLPDQTTSKRSSVIQKANHFSSKTGCFHAVLSNLNHNALKSHRLNQKCINNKSNQLKMEPIIKKRWKF